MSKWIAACAAMIIAFVAPGRALAEVQAIAPGDALTISVLGEDQLSGKFTVAADGTLAFPLVGVVALEGLSNQQAAARLSEKLADFVKQPRVTVEIAERGKVRALLSGAVKTPGVYSVTAGTRVSELVVVSGGATDKADLAGIKVVRGQGGMVAADLTRVALGDIAYDPVLLSGDQVIVPVLAAQHSVRILGEVAKPGSYAAAEPVPLWEALALAGGLLPSASPSEAVVTKAGGQMLPVDMTRLLTAQGILAGVMLDAGDTLTVPSASTRVHVIGAVQKPGTYPLPKGSMLHEALAAAGGLGPDARPAEAYLMRSQPQRPGQVERITLRLDRLLQKGDFTQNVALQNGDVVVVPQSARKSDRTLLEKVAPLLGPLMYAIF